jgi:molybdopterin/thiamine biosynthesis adenylyltransferase
MKNLTTKHTALCNKTEGQITVTAPTPDPKEPCKDMIKTVKHSAHVVASDAGIIGGDIKEASKELLHDSKKKGKDTCDCSEKAILTATEKALKAASLVTAKSAKSVHKAAEAK